MNELAVGSKAPEFSAPDQSGKTVSLADFKGRTVVIYFYPKDDTPGCTTQACSYRDGYAEFKKKGVVVLGISPEDGGGGAGGTLTPSHRPRIKRCDLGEIRSISSYYGELPVDRRRFQQAVDNRCVSSLPF
jgi:hypothetical protein